MKCKRGHSNFHQIKLAVKKKKFCDHILGYKMTGDSVTNTLLCGDLPIGEPIPKVYIPLQGLYLDG